jgi:hypothetical protein
VRHLRERQQQQQQHQQQSGGRSSSSSGAGGGAAAAGAALEAGSGTLASHTMSLLCHAFILIAGVCVLTGTRLMLALAKV